MKFAFFFVVMVCTTALYVCKAQQRSSVCRDLIINKPSAHIEAASKYVVVYHAKQMIKDWSVSAPFSHLAGCMKYHDGKLTVPIPGRYYIYLQAYYHTTGRILMRVNGRVITMIQIPGRSGHGTAYVGGIFNLKAGDVITMTSAGSNFKLYMDTVHTYFGAYLI
mmetsp:Transcript_18012/g.29656  ORF Transcript_18012/g.29656 Transcript_18012/m.29656 type:complete len:164 (-) Transcript_18012:82-573(-)